MQPASLTSTDYRRAARRLRWVHRNDPLRRARSLRELSHRFDQPSDPIPSTGPVESVRQFARRVANELDGSTLLYSNRLKLLRAARRQGIRRFDANLIIAAVQDRVPNVSPPRANGRPSRSSAAATLAVAIVVQAMILLGAWCVLWRGL